MIELTMREKEVLEKIPSDRWVNQLSLGTSKPVLSKLCNAKLVAKKPIPNPSHDPRRGLVYKRQNTQSPKMNTSDSQSEDHWK